MAKNTNAKTSHAKGEEFERLFGEFMKAELGWEKVSYRTQVKAKNNSKGYQIDIVGIKKDKRGQQFHKLFKKFILLALLFIILGLYLCIRIEWDGLPLVIFWWGVIFEIGGLISLILSDKLNTENAWVECKNLKDKVDIKHIMITLHELNEYKKTNDKEYKFVTHYFASSSGYVENALKEAERNGIICYWLKDGKFCKKERWE